MHKETHKYLNKNQIYSSLHQKYSHNSPQKITNSSTFPSKDSYMTSSIFFFKSTKTDFNYPKKHASFALESKKYISGSLHPTKIRMETFKTERKSEQSDEVKNLRIWKARRQMVFESQLLLKQNVIKDIIKDDFFPKIKITKRKFKAPKNKNISNLQEYCPWKIDQQQMSQHEDQFHVYRP